MPRKATGEVQIYERVGGGETFYARFRANNRRWRIKLGTDLEGWSPQRAENEVAKIVDRVARGVWKPPSPSRSPKTEDPTFHEFASQWFARKRRGLGKRTVEDYDWRLRGHLLPFFAAYQLSEIDVAAVDHYREAKLAERDERRDARQPALSNDSINATLALLAMILDEAIEHKLPVEVPNPAASKRRRLKSQRGKRSFLEPDQAAALLEAAGVLDRSGALSWEDVLAIRASRETNVAIARQLGVSDSLVSRIRKRRAWRTRAAEPARRPVIATLLLAGPRIAELCALNVGDVDLPNRRLLIEDAKTEAGRRPILLSDLLTDELGTHLDRMGPTGPRRPLFVNTRGERYTPSGIRTAILAPTLRRAAEVLASMPEQVTPHTLRRTYISLLLAGGADVPWVMAQVGHTDPKVTLQIYAQVVQSQRRDYGTKVDQMIHGATPNGARNGTKNLPADDSTSDTGTSRMAESQ